MRRVISRICPILILLVAAMPSLGSLEAAHEFTTRIMAKLEVTVADCRPPSTDRDVACGSTELSQSRFIEAWDQYVEQLKADGTSIVAESAWQAGRIRNTKERSYLIEQTPLTVVYMVSGKRVVVSYINYSWNKWPCDRASFEADETLHSEDQDATIAPPRVIAGEPPPYPKMARLARQQGRVSVTHVVETDGTVTSACISGPYQWNVGFEELALKAVRNWRFEPATRDGKPIRRVTTSEVNFRLEPAKTP